MRYNLIRFDTGAVATEQELDHVSGNRVLARVFSDQILSDQIPVENRCRELVQMIQFHRHVSSPTVVGL